MVLNVVLRVLPVLGQRLLVRIEELLSESPRVLENCVRRLRRHPLVAVVLVATGNADLQRKRPGSSVRISIRHRGITHGNLIYYLKKAVNFRGVGSPGI